MFEDSQCMHGEFEAEIKVDRVLPSQYIMIRESMSFLLNRCVHLLYSFNLRINRRPTHMKNKESRSLFIPMFIVQQESPGSRERTISIDRGIIAHRMQAEVAGILEPGTVFAARWRIQSLSKVSGLS
jgi:hypothetical protein